MSSTRKLQINKKFGAMTVCRFVDMANANYILDSLKHYLYRVIFQGDWNFDTMFCKVGHIIAGRRLVCVICAISISGLFTGPAFGASTKTGKTLAPRTLRSMARLYMAFGEYDKAQPLVERALATAKNADTPDYELAMCLIDAAYLYKNQNNLNNAQAMCEQGLELQQRCIDKDHPYMAYTLRILSSIYQQQGKSSEAMSALDKAEAVILANQIEDDFVAIPLMIDRAKLLAARGRIAEAYTNYRQALSIMDKYYPEHFYKVSICDDFAQFLISQGKYAEAEPLINDSIGMKEKAYGAEHHLLVPTLFLKACIEQEKGNHSACETFIHRALTAVKKTDNISKIVEAQLNAKMIRGGRGSEIIVAHAVTGRQLTP